MELLIFGAAAGGLAFVVYVLLALVLRVRGINRGRRYLTPHVPGSTSLGSGLDGAGDCDSGGGGGGC
jgi:hypothetical protein